MKWVLVVDDDADVLRYTAMTLTRGGVKAITAQSGDEALSIVKRRHKEIRLLITDIVMPRMTGIDLALAVGGVDPKLRIMFMTGYVTDHLEQFGPALNGHQILKKPFTPAELLASVDHALHSAGSQ